MATKANDKNEQFDLSFSEHTVEIEIEEPLT